MRTPSLVRNRKWSRQGRRGRSLLLCRRARIRIACAVSLLAGASVVYVAVLFGHLESSDRLVGRMANDPTRATTDVDKRLRYHEVEPLEWSESDPNMVTAYQEATVVRSATPWFRPRVVCKETCCAQSVAISLAQDDTRIISSVDGVDLSDVQVRAIRGWPSYLTYHATDLTPRLLPCLQPGTIINSDNFGSALSKFFTQLRPNITVPYLLINGVSDARSPMFRSHLAQDKLLLKWYGNNPYFHPSITDEERQKFVSRPFGLSKYHPQMPHLLHYLRANHFANPFEDKTRWTHSIELADAIDTTNLMFVRFDIHHKRSKKIRKAPFHMACHGRTIAARDNLTCRSNADQEFSVHDTYMAASHYLFGLSPPGGGLDCYRTYEYLILGIIPIVSRPEPEFMEMWQHLPILFLDPHWNYTQMELVTMMRNYVTSDSFQTDTFDIGWERLFLRYWRRKMLTDTNRLDDIRTDEQGFEYYQAWHYTTKQ